MTSNKEKNKDRDAILAAFLNECPQPSPAQIAGWRQRYPRFAADIMNLAADLYALANARENQPKDRTVERARRDDEAALESFRKKRRRVEQCLNSLRSDAIKAAGRRRRAALRSLISGLHSTAVGVGQLPSLKTIRPVRGHAPFAAILCIGTASP